MHTNSYDIFDVSSILATFSENVRSHSEAFGIRQGRCWNDFFFRLTSYLVVVSCWWRLPKILGLIRGVRYQTSKMLVYLFHTWSQLRADDTCRTFVEMPGGSRNKTSGSVMLYTILSGALVLTTPRKNNKNCTTVFFGGSFGFATQAENHRRRSEQIEVGLNMVGTFWRHLPKKCVFIRRFEVETP